MHSAPGQQDGQQDHARDDVEGIKPPSPPPTEDSGIATRYDPVGYIHHDDDEAADTAPTSGITSGITSGAAAAAGDATSDTASNTTDTNTFANTGSTPSVLAEAVKDGVEEDEDEDDAVDDSEDLDEESTNVRKTTSFYRRRHSMSDTRLQDVMGFPFRPLVRPLTISDLDSCEALEKSAFSAEHAASREKFEYRLSTCPELCLGLFCTVVPSIAKKHGFDIETLDTAKPVETGRPDGALSVLVAHIVSTKCIGDLVTDESMDYPRDFRTNKTSSSSGRTEAGASTGHQPQGNTVALHSLAVHPRLHGCGLGKLIVKAYLQHVKGASLADRVSLICQDYLVTYYAKHGFANMGKSTATYGGGGWFDMTIEIGNGNGIGK